MASSVEVEQPGDCQALPITSPKPAWGGAGLCSSAVEGTSVWGEAASSQPSQPSPASFRDLMSEDLAKDMQDKEYEAVSQSLLKDEKGMISFLSHQEETSDDLILAQMLQYEFDREYDQQVNREEKIYNGNSKVSVSFDKFRICPGWYGPDSDDELHDIDDENRAIDSFEARQRKDPVIPPCGYIKQGTKMVTKHDLNISGRKNAERIMNLPPGINTGDGGGFDMQLPNKVYNKLQRSAMAEIKKKHRVHDKVEKATSEMALDPRTRLIMFKLVNNAVLDAVNGVVSAGKEAVVFHAQGGGLEEQPIPENCAIKVFKTTLTDFKTREKYIKEDYRFRDRLSKHNTQKLIQMWAEKEYHNLRRLQKAQIPAPEPVLIKKHVLVMSFIGHDHQPAPKLKDARLSSSDLKLAYEQVIDAMIKMFGACHLVHADLSEYNILWHERKCWIIDVGQAVEPAHPNALHFLHRDCTNILKFFHSKGLSKLPSPLELFEKVSGISLPGPEESAHRMIEEYETHQEQWRESLNHVSDQFEFLWQEIKAEEQKQKALCKQAEEDNDDADDLGELVMGEYGVPVKYLNKKSSEANTAGEEATTHRKGAREADGQCTAGPQADGPTTTNSSHETVEKQSKKKKNKSKKKQGC